MSSSNDKTTNANSALKPPFDATQVQDMYAHKRRFPDAPYEPPPQTGYMGDYRPEGKAAEEKAARDAIDPNPKNLPPTPRPTESTRALLDGEPQKYVYKVYPKETPRPVAEKTGDSAEGDK
jgi:hypothetical protein